MATYYVCRPNPYFKVGTFLQDSDPGFVQRTVLTQQGPQGWYGMLVPTAEVREFTIKLRKWGLDWAKGGALGYGTVRT